MKYGRQRQLTRTMAMFIGVVLSAIAGAAVPDGDVAAGAPWVVCFTPGDDCTNTIVTVVAGARRNVYVQAFSFTSKPIARALVAARERGVRVEVILDRGSLREHHAAADLLAGAGVPVLIDGAHVLAHNKVMIIDEETVVTGSFNFTYAAQRDNAENVLILHDPVLAVRYQDNWKAHRAHAEPYERR
jgi:phosphatidylserine/phosphatidylglycerophosphate/cardiolipin synthase-like enzyme